MECPRITWQGSVTVDFILLAGTLSLWLSSGLPHNSWGAARVGSGFLVIPQFPVGCDSKISQRHKRISAATFKVFNHSFFFLLKRLDSCQASLSFLLEFSVASTYPHFTCCSFSLFPKGEEDDWNFRNKTKKKQHGERRKSAVTTTEGGQMVENLCRPETKQNKLKNTILLSSPILKKKLFLKLSWVIGCLYLLKPCFNA